MHRFNGPAGAAGAVATLLAAGLAREPKGRSYQHGLLNFIDGALCLRDGRRFEWPDAIVLSDEQWVLTKRQGVGEPLHIARTGGREYWWVFWDPIAGFSVIQQPAPELRPPPKVEDSPPPRPTRKRYVPVGRLPAQMGALVLHENGELTYLDQFFDVGVPVDFTAVDGVRLTRKACAKAELAIDVFGQVRRFVYLYEFGFQEWGWYEVLREDGLPPAPRKPLPWDPVVNAIARFEVRAAGLATVAGGVLLGQLFAPAFYLCILGFVLFLVSCVCACPSPESFFQSVE
jgi:hypothetical protein